MTVLVDTHVLIDVVQDDPAWGPWSLRQLRAHSPLHALAINPVIYAELSLSYSTLEGLDAAVATMQLQLHELSRPALFLAAKAFAQYRRRGGAKAQVLPDFFIGAQAAVMRWPLLTRDSARFASYFPTVELICP
jgi:predicted nucleic acid-binding protein